MTTAVERTDLYPSRIEADANILPRRDPVVYGQPAEHGGGPLSAAQLADYERDGFLILPEFLSEPQVAACLREVRRLCESDEARQRPEAIIEPESNELRSMFAIHRISPFFRRVAADERIVRMLEQLLASQVYIHQSRMNLKPGFRGKEFYWHSDFETWHMEDGMPRMRAISCSILLTRNYECNGPLMLVPGSHQKYIACVGETPENHYQQSLRRQEYGVPDPASLTMLVEDGGIETVTGAAGTLVLFECNTMHGSHGNITPWPRTNLFVVYNSVENRLQDPFCGLKPRPEFIAAREHDETIAPQPVDYAA